MTCSFQPPLRSRIRGGHSKWPDWDNLRRSVLDTPLDQSFNHHPRLARDRHKSVTGHLNSMLAPRMPCKICVPIKYDSSEWKKYCLWRNYTFSDFRSLDSTIRGSCFEVTENADWDHALTVGTILTDVVTDVDYAKKIKGRYKDSIIERFDYVENYLGDETDIVGYDILDGGMSYSLLTNFGNDIIQVNSILTRNGLIRHRRQVLELHKWFLGNFINDGHVDGSRIVCVYKELG